MSYLTTSSTTMDSPNYQFARDLGYELSKDQFSELYNYAKMVHLEQFKDQVASIKSTKLFSSRSDKILRNSHKPYSEDLWIKYLREYFDNELNGLSLPAYDIIKGREQNALNEIRHRRLKSLFKLKNLPDDLEKILKDIFAQSESTEVIQKFCIPITVRDLKTLRSPNWLNDEVINFYFELLYQRSNQQSDLPKLYIFNSFFYPKLKSNGHGAIKRWTRKVDIFDYDMILMPIHLGIHWCCAEINIKERSIIYYDSLHNNNMNCLKLLQQYLIEEHIEKKGTDGSAEFDLKNWNLSLPKAIPCQQNGYDCGVFTCTFAEYRSRGDDFTFFQKDMYYFRDKITYEIIKGKLFL